MRHLGHLVRRFFGSLRPRTPAPDDGAWADGALTRAERGEWDRLSGDEQAYAIRVARAAVHDLAGTPDATDDRWIAAALLHDVGKLDADLGVPGRVTATVLGVVVRRDRARTWSARAGGARARLGRYLLHDERGAARLRAAGARAEVATWAEVHHRRDRWEGSGIPARVCAALAAADDL